MQLCLTGQSLRSPLHQPTGIKSALCHYHLHLAHLIGYLRKKAGVMPEQLPTHFHKLVRHHASTIVFQYYQTHNDTHRDTRTLWRCKVALEVSVKYKGGTLLDLCAVATIAFLQDTCPRLQHLLKGLHVQLILVIQLEGRK